MSRVAWLKLDLLIGEPVNVRVQVPDWIETDEELNAYEHGFMYGALMVTDAPALAMIEVLEGLPPDEHKDISEVDPDVNP